ncbi:cytochrome P450 [Rickenella mellea]|uniref:Cytochrome P450 n=1 Tax=Rickenella mellea TaxID=50990 RepID=A0A4Y7QM95_9AGAM|nr:cytochrome P450 [Rickenella mellea]
MADGQVVSATLFSPLRKIPGPKLAGITDLWMLFQVLRGRGSIEIDRCFREYGDIVRIGPSSVVVRKPEDYTEIYVGHKYRKDARMAKLRIFGIENVISAVDPGVHRHLRKLTNPLFTSESVKALQRPLQELLDDLFVHIDQSSRRQESANMWNLYRLLAFDFLGQAAFGNSFAALRKGTEMALMHDMDKFFRLLTIKTGLPSWVYDMTCCIPVSKWQDIVHSETRLMTLDNEIDRKGMPLSESFLCSTILIFLIAGTDTTSTSLAWITWALARYPQIYKRLRKELEVAIPDADILPDYTSLRRLPYLSAVIKEGLRRWPPASLYLPRIAPPGGAVHCGCFIPESTSIGCSPYAMHRNENIFPDPDKYEPERWLEESNGIYTLKSSSEMMSSYMAWSTGVRSCQGQPLAEMELYCVIAALTRRYEFYPDPETTDDSMREFETLLLQPISHSLKIKFEQKF